MTTAGARPHRAYIAALAGWLVAALVLAWLRVPYDDEWFSIDAARLSHSELLRSLSRDIHPPWVAQLDWLIAQVTTERFALHIPRLLASLLAIHLLSQTLARRTSLAPTLVALACLHPLLLFYGGAIRWYPYVFLAQAARLWALWGADAGPRSNMAFTLGALGPAAGYVDLPFLLHDCAWWLARERSRHRASIPIVALTLGATTVFAGTLLTDTALPFGLGALRLAWRDAVAWLGVGLAGPAHPEWPWWLPAALVPFAIVLGWWRINRTHAVRPLGGWALATLLLWAAAAVFGFGVSSPRYSLLLWPTATVGIVWLAARERASLRVLGAAALAYLAVVLGHVYAGEGFVKSDLNDLDARDCAELPEADLIVAGYPRLHELVLRRCDPAAPVIRLPHVRHMPEHARLLAPLRAHLDAQPRVLHLYPGHRSASPERTRLAVRAELARQCVPVETTHLAEVPHRRLKELVRRADRPGRIVAETWRCDGDGPSRDLPR